MALLSCKREIKPSLIGVWVSSNPIMQLTIHNTDGVGNFINFTKQNEGGNDYLIMNNLSVITKYKILRLSVDTLNIQLPDSSKVELIRSR